MNSPSNLLEQVQNDNDFYKSIIENNSFYIIRTDLEGNYSYMNPFFLQRFGLEVDLWIGKPSLELILPVDHQLCIDTVTLCFEHPKQTHWVVLRKPCQDEILYTEWEFSLLFDSNGAPTEVLCIGHDITSQILKQEELRTLVDVTSDQNKRLVNFTYIISHNIRSHVANIIGIMSLSEEEDEQEKVVLWDMLKTSVGNLDSTIQNLNEVISIQSQTNLPIKRIFVKPEIERTLKSIETLVTDAGTTVEYQLSAEDYIDVNPSYFESILLNIITNAIKYKSPSRPLHLKIAIGFELSFTTLTFEDNGLGIDLDKYQDQLFGMYKTFNGNADAKGLGLFIIRSQIEAMQGKIEAFSELGSSTTFKLSFKR
jgi:PAS domain S-box-containing protein